MQVAVAVEAAVAVAVVALIAVDVIDAVVGMETVMAAVAVDLIPVTKD